MGITVDEDSVNARRDFLSTGRAGIKDFFAGYGGKVAGYAGNL